MDANVRRAPMTQMWAFVGYDEPNYTYTGADLRAGRRPSPSCATRRSSSASPIRKDARRAACRPTHDDDLPAPPADVELLVDGAQGRSVEVTHQRIDATHSNAYEAWKKMGSPQPPTKAQYKQLERAGQLQALEPSRRVKVEDRRVRLTFTLPRQAVSLVRMTW